MEQDLLVRGAPKLVRNMQAGPTVFADDSTGLKPVVWQGRDDPSGADIRTVPWPLFDSVQFQTQLSFGVFQVVEDAEEAARIRDSKRHQFERDALARQRQSQGLLQSATDNDILMIGCIAPGVAGLCGTTVSVVSAKRHEQPPLCQAHQHLRDSFVPQETDRIVNGRPEVAWMRTAMGSPQRAQEGFGG